MRARLLGAVLGLCMATLVIVCLPLAFVAQSLTEQDFDQRLGRNTENLAAAIRVITARGDEVRPADLARLVPADRRAVYVPHRGPTIAAGHVAGSVRTRTKNVAGGRLEFSSPLQLLHDRITRIWLIIAGLGIAALTAAVVVALFMARWFTGPLNQLALRAERIGAGDLRPAAARYAIPELQRLAAVLDWSAAQLSRILERERHRSRDTSHQLRTPLTGLSMRLEEIRNEATHGAIREHADAALEQVHRLTELAESTLGQGEGTLPVSQVCDAVLVLAAQARDCEPVFRRAGRSLALELPRTLLVNAPAAPVSQAVSALLENALAHGAGTVTVAARTLGEYAVLEVSDEGPGIADELAPLVFRRGVSGADGTGLGLALARSSIEGCGGRLELVRAAPPTFAIYLMSAG